MTRRCRCMLRDRLPCSTELMLCGGVRLMRNWLAVMAAMILYAAEPEGAAGGPIDCGPTPTVPCLSAAIFSLARMLPDDNYFRRNVSFAERELAPGDIKTALR